MKKFLVLVMALLLIIGCMTIANASETQCEGAQNHDFGTNQVVTVKPATCTAKGEGTKLCNNCGKDISVEIPMDPHTPAAGADQELKNQDGETEFKCGDVKSLYVSKCATCEKPYSKVVETIQHTFDTTVENGKPKYGTVQAATCTTPEITTYTCTRTGCNGTKPVETAAKLGHTWKIVDDGIIAPTCTAAGKAGKYALCEVCGEAYDGTVLYLDANRKEVKADLAKDEYILDAVVIPQLSHDVDTEWGEDFLEYYFYYDEGEFIWPGFGVNTLVEGEREQDAFSGSYTYTALNGKTYGPFNAKSGKVTVDWKAPTCTTGGYLTVKCACGKFDVTETLEAYGHYYDVLTLSYADFKGNGRMMNVELIALIDELDLDIDIDSTDPIDAALVEKIANAIKAQYSASELMKVLYSLDQKAQYPQMDCTVQPMLIFECEECDNTLKFLAAANDEHNFGLTGDTTFAKFDKKVNDGLISVYPMEDDDFYHYVLSGKPAIKSITQTVVGHSQAQKFNNYRDVKSCTDFTVEMYCAYCAQTKEFKVTGTGHEGDDWYDDETVTIFRPATCTSNGLKWIECDEGCGFKKTAPIPQKDHEIDPTKTKVVSATCESNGTRSFVCKNCDYGKAGEWFEEIPSYGHDYEWTYVKAADKPSCTKTGTLTEVCQNCGGKRGTKTVDKAHVLKDLDNLVLKNVTKAAVEAAAKLNEDGNYVIDASKIMWNDCTKDGSVQFTCINCYTVTIAHKAAAAHDLKNNGAVKCDTPDYTYIDNTYCQHNTLQPKACKHCVKAIDDEKKPEKQEHNWDGKTFRYVTDGEATCTAGGYMWKLCEDCGYWFTDEDPVITHTFAPKYDAEKDTWFFECMACGHVEGYDAKDEKYELDMSKATFGNRSTGYGVAKLDDNLGDYAFLLGDRYALVYLVYENKNGEQTVISMISEIDENGKFSVKGASVSATMKLQYVLVAIVDDANADELDLADVKAYGDYYKAF